MQDETTHPDPGDEPMRCRDCRFYRIEWHECCFGGGWRHYPDPDDPCSRYGEPSPLQDWGGAGDAERKRPLVGHPRTKGTRAPGATTKTLTSNRANPPCI